MSAISSFEWFNNKPNTVVEENAWINQEPSNHFNNFKTQNVYEIFMKNKSIKIIEELNLILLSRLHNVD